MTRREAGEAPVYPGPTLQELLKSYKTYMRFRGHSERVSVMTVLNMYWRAVDSVNVISEAPVAERQVLTRRVHGFIDDACAALQGKKSARVIPALKYEADMIPHILVEDKKVLLKLLMEMCNNLEFDFEEKTEE
ncbi:MAG TPA: hypothetical protein VJH33_02825 [Candidatus Paceibacterota bacterium]